MVLAVADVGLNSASQSAPELSRLISVIERLGYELAFSNGEFSCAAFRLPPLRCQALRKSISVRAAMHELRRRRGYARSSSAQCQGALQSNRCQVIAVKDRSTSADSGPVFRPGDKAHQEWKSDCIPQ